MAKNEPRLVWSALGLAILAALLDRFAVLGLIDAVYSQGLQWRLDLTWVFAATACAFLASRWACIATLSLADRASDRLLTIGTNRLTGADWRKSRSDAPSKALLRLATSMRQEGRQAATALPAFIVLPMTGAWLAFYTPEALLVVAVTVAAGTSFLRRDIARADASNLVAGQAERAVGDMIARVLDAGALLRLATIQTVDFPKQALWPAIDDASRSASVDARANARVAGLFGWFFFLLIIVALALNSDTTQDSDWTRALLVIAATFHHARHAITAYIAFCRFGTAAAEIDVMTQDFTPAAPSPVAPARWTSVAFNQVRIEEHETPVFFAAAIGPLDLDLRPGEIIALTGPGTDDRVTLLHVLCGLLQPDAGTIRLDGRPVVPTMLRGLCGALLDPSTPLQPPVTQDDQSRVNQLLTRFDLPQAMLQPIDSETTARRAQEQTRLSIVIAQLQDRPIQLYDERATYLPPRFRPAFSQTLQEARSRGRTSVVATADAGIIAIADRVLRLQDGLLVAADAPAR